jgi:hypothetical protein
LAEHAGHRGPQAMQRLLCEAVWDADAVRDDVRDLVVQTLGCPEGVLGPERVKPRLASLPSSAVAVVAGEAKRFGRA